MKLLRDLDIPSSAHGLRATFRFMVLRHRRAKGSRGDGAGPCRARRRGWPTLEATCWSAAARSCRSGPTTSPRHMHRVGSGPTNENCVGRRYNVMRVGLLLPRRRTARTRVLLHKVLGRATRRVRRGALRPIRAPRQPLRPSGGAHRHSRRETVAPLCSGSPPSRRRASRGCDRLLGLGSGGRARRRGCRRGTSASCRDTAGSVTGRGGVQEHCGSLRLRRVQPGDGHPALADIALVGRDRG